jgi:hypothetical protein
MDMAFLNLMGTAGFGITGALVALIVRRQVRFRHCWLRCYLTAGQRTVKMRVSLDLRNRIHAARPRNVDFRRATFLDYTRSEPEVAHFLAVSFAKGTHERHSSAQRPACSWPGTVRLGTANRVTDWLMDVADRSTDIARAQTPCGAATEQHYT